jgi:lysophospholipase L1-like esterase
MTPIEHVRARLAASPAAVWVYCGDSITAGALHTVGWRDYTQHVAEHVRCRRGWGLNVIVNTAIARSTTREMLAQFDQRVRRFRPDVVVLMSGINDCADRHAMAAEEFRANLLELVRRPHGGHGDRLRDERRGQPALPADRGEPGARERGTAGPDEVHGFSDRLLWRGVRRTS